MTKNNYIIKKTYVAPFVAFEEIEEELELLAGTYTEGGAGNVVQDPEDTEGGVRDPGAKPATGDVTDGGAKATYDFVFEYE